MVATVPGTDGKVFEGGCHCGSVRFRLTGPLRQILVCHCDDCRRFSSASRNSTKASGGKCELLSDDSLTWYDSSRWARRGFCSICGSHLFYQLKTDTDFSVGAGMLDDANGLTIAGQLFADSHPGWGPVSCETLPHMDEELLAAYANDGKETD